MTYSLGVDLGTTYSAAAVHESGSTQMVSLGYATTIVPSAVFVTPDGEALVGEAALRRGTTTPDRLSREFKRRMGDSVPLLLGGSPFSAEALTGRLLAWIVGTVVEQRGEAPDRLAVTHPANWGPFKHDRLVQSIRLADLAQVVAGHRGRPAGAGGTRSAGTSAEVPTSTLTEPEAAAISYAAAERVPVGEVVAVYDLGGGTFDGAVLRKAEVGFEVLGTPEGIERLGGIDIDEAVFQHVVHAIGDAVDGMADDDPIAMRAVSRLRLECVEAKEALSSDTDVSIPVVLPGLQTEIRLTRMELEAMVRPVLDDTVRALRRTIVSADLAPSDIDRVLLVGGSSRMPLVAELVTEALERPVFVDAHPKHAVALGAALAAAGLPGAETAARPVALAAASLAGAGSTDPEGAPAAQTGGGTVPAAPSADVSPGSVPPAEPPVAAPEAPAAGHDATTLRAASGAEGTARPPDARVPPDWDGEAITLELGPRRDPLASPTLELPDSLRPAPHADLTDDSESHSHPDSDVAVQPTARGGGAAPGPSAAPPRAGDAGPGALTTGPSAAVEGAGTGPAAPAVGDRAPGDAARSSDGGAVDQRREPPPAPDADGDVDSPWGPERSPAARPGPGQGPGSGRAKLIAGALAAVVVLVVGVLVLRGGGEGDDDATDGGPSSTSPSDEDSAEPATPELAVGEPIGVGEFPDGIALVDDQLVVASTFAGSVAAIDVGSGRVELTQPLDGEPLAVLVAEGSVWVTQRAADTVARIDPATGEVLATIDAPGKPVDLAFGAGSIWAAGGDGILTRIDPATNDGETVQEGIATLSAVVATDERVWLTHGTNQVAVLDPATNQLTLDWATAGQNTDEAVLADSGLWVLNRDEGTVSQLDRDTGEEITRVDVGTEPAGITVDAEDGDRLWVIDNTDGTLVLIDGPSGRVLTRQDVGADPLGVTTTPGRVWVTLSGDHAVAPVTVSG